MESESEMTFCLFFKSVLHCNSKGIGKSLLSSQSKVRRGYQYSVVSDQVKGGYSSAGHLACQALLCS